MNIKCCDICYYDGDGKIVDYVARTGYTHREKIDVCSKHRGWGKGKTLEQFYSELTKLKEGYYGRKEQPWRCAH